MYSYSHYSMEGERQRVWLARVLAAFLLALLALGMAAAPGRALAADEPTPQVNFTSPIYPGQNNGGAEGPVGAIVTVAGSGWTAGSGPVTLDLVDASLDANGQAGSACVSAPSNKRVKISDVQPSPLTVDKNDDFIATFTWPDGANAVGHSYWVCGGRGGTTYPGTDKYLVMGANPPSLSIGSDTTIPVKSTITVKGENWLPGNQPVTVLLLPCVDCDGQPLLTQTTTASSDGTFSLDITLPNSVEAGTTLYVAAANNASSSQVQPALIVNGPDNAPKFTVVDEPTPTPSPSPTATNTVTPTKVATGTGNNTNKSSSSGLLIVLLSALGVVLVLAAVVAVLLFVRSRKPLPESTSYSPSGGYPPQGGYGTQGGYGSRRTGGPGPTSDYTNVGYYDDPPHAGGRSGPPGGYGQRGAGWGGQGWQGGPQGQLPDDSASGDQPTISSPPPWH